MVCDCIDSRTSLFTSLQDSCDTPRALRCFFVFTSSPCSSRWCLALFLYSSTFLAHVCLTRNHPSFLEVREFKGGWVVSCFYAQRYWYRGFIPALHLDNTQSFQTKPFFVNLYCSCGFMREAKWAVCDLHCSQTRASPSWKHAFSIQHMFV